MTAPGILAMLALILCAREARADLSFIQVVQSQTSHGQQGLFGKTWIELSGRRMRLVSGYAGKIGVDGKAAPPTCLIQIIDLDEKARLILYPKTKTYVRGPLNEIGYDARLAKALKRGRPLKKIEILGLKLSKQMHVRRLLGVWCEHYRLSAELALVSAHHKRESARMDQDIWVAPVTGPLSNAILELIAFENAYRRASGGKLTPLDYERYQLREAAAYLQVPESGLHRVAEKLRERLRGLPSYPVASSVSWWVSEEPKNPPPGSRPIIPVYARGSASPLARTDRHLRFVVINWHDSERRINRMYRLGGFPLGPLHPTIEIKRPTEHPNESSIYPEFRVHFQEIISLILEAKARNPPHDPFYETYAQIHGLSSTSTLPASDFALPRGYVRRP